MVAGPRKLASLTPVIPSELRRLVADLDMELLVPASRTATEVALVLADADVALADWSGRLPLGATEAAVATPVSLVLSPGVGVESIDLEAWAQRGVPVANAAGANAISVAEWCVAATIAVLRSMLWADAEMRTTGRWPQADLAVRGCRELRGRRVGLVGFGAIGQACAPRFAAFGCAVSYWSRHRRPPADEFGATYRDLDELFAESEVVVLAIASTPETAQLVNQTRLSLMPSDAILVNAARGAVVDEAALVSALSEGRLAGAALDVFSSEPLASDSPLRSCERALLSPHAASVTTEALRAIFSMTADNLRRALTGEPTVSVVNGVEPIVHWRR